MSQPFTHLHCHSHFSTLDGASDIDSLIREAKRHGQTALAITDHGSLHGAIEFYKKAKAAGIKPIIGMEAYVSPGSRLIKTVETRGSYHLTLLAKNLTGYQNLLKLSTEANRSGFYYKPRVDWELLTQYAEGIICLSGCVQGELSKALLASEYDRLSRERAARIADAFLQMYGDNYYLEIQNNGLEIQRQALERTVDLAKYLCLPLVASSDCHYARQEDAASQDMLLCIGTRMKLNDSKRIRFDTDEFYLRSADDMYNAFPGNADAVARSQTIADSIDFDLPLGRRHFPVYSKGSFNSSDPTNAGILRTKCLVGLRERVGRYLNTAEGERLERELTIIHTCGFDDYFLIIDDIFDFCRTNKIPASIRGSGVGALTSYALSFTDINPLEFNLLFERFLDPLRGEAPDIDIDVCKERRGEVIQYIRDAYGNDCVAQIATFGTLGIKAAIRDVARVLDLPQGDVNKISAMLPKRPQNQAHLVMTVDDALAESPALTRAYNDDTVVKDLLDKVRPLVGLVRHIGTHAAAVVISDGPLTEYVPLCRVKDEGDLVTQYAMKEVEDVGLLKLDLLGLKTLTLLRKVCDLIPDGLDLRTIPLDDSKTFRLFQRGEAKGVFQMESDGMQSWMKKLKPDKFEDLVALNALYRPGPLLGGMAETYVQVKHGRVAATYVHPLLEPILSQTYGVMVYQEQVMQILHQVGGIDLTYAYTCIKAISKKKQAVMDHVEREFMNGAIGNGLMVYQAISLWNMILEFAKYGFNRAHAVAYALIAYRTAYLKARYPKEFMAALLTTDIPNRNLEDLRKDKLTEHLKDCLRMKIAIISPDVNASGVDFLSTPGGIVFALSAIKGCKHNLYLIPQERKRGGPFLSLQDFVRRIDIQAIGKATVKTLIEAGAFDSIPGSRSDKVAALPDLLKAKKKAAKDRASGQQFLFWDEEALDLPLPRVQPRSKTGRLALEHKLLGFCFSQGNDDDMLN